MLTGCQSEISDELPRASETRKVTDLRDDGGGDDRPHALERLHGVADRLYDRWVQGLAR